MNRKRAAASTLCTSLSMPVAAVDCAVLVYAAAAVLQAEAGSCGVRATGQDENLCIALLLDGSCCRCCLRLVLLTAAARAWRHPAGQSCGHPPDAAATVTRDTDLESTASVEYTTLSLNNRGTQSENVHEHEHVHVHVHACAGA
jgi:hypothetical protein